MERPYTAAPGVGLNSISLFNATPIRGIQIDNPTGGWLYVVELSDYCPPYTMQWSRDLPYAGSAVTIQYGISPAGQISTTAGTAYTVTIYDKAVGAQAGIAASFNSQFTPVLSSILNHTYVNGDAVASFTLNTAITGGVKRIRLHGIVLSVSGNPKYVNTPILGSFHKGGTDNPDVTLRIAASKVHDERIYDPYLDLAVGQEFTLTLTNWTTAFLSTLFTNGLTSFAPELTAYYELI